jgi:hypothetical protein
MRQKPNIDNSTNNFSRNPEKRAIVLLKLCAKDVLASIRNGMTKSAFFMFNISILV